MIKKKKLGKHVNGEDIIQYTLTNENGIEVKILNYGAIIQAINLPLPTKKKNIVLGFDDYKEYLTDEYKANCPYFGATVGRIAGRVKNGELYCDGRVTQLNCNEGKNHLHGGNEGLDKKIWNFHSSDDDSLSLKYISEDGEENYANRLEVYVTFKFLKNNKFAIYYEARADKPTAANITNHTYFNLSNKKNTIDHNVTLRAEEYLVTDENNIHTGEIKSVEGRLDLSKDKTLAETMEGKGYDTTFYNSDKYPYFNIMLWSADTNIKVEIDSISPCLQLYTGEYIKTKKHGKYSGIAIESMNVPYLPLHFNNLKYSKNNPFRSIITYHFYYPGDGTKEYYKEKFEEYCKERNMMDKEEEEERKFLP